MNSKLEKSLGLYGLNEMMDEEGEIIPIIADGDDADMEETDFPGELPILIT